MHQGQNLHPGLVRERNFGVQKDRDDANTFAHLSGMVVRKGSAPGSRARPGIRSGSAGDGGGSGSGVNIPDPTRNTWRLCRPAPHSDGCRVDSFAIVHDNSGVSLSHKVVVSLSRASTEPHRQHPQRTKGRTWQGARHSAGFLLDGGHVGVYFKDGTLADLCVLGNLSTTLFKT